MGNIARFNVILFPRYNVIGSTYFFKNSFFPSTVTEQNNLEKSIRSSESFVLFKKSNLQFIRPTPNGTFNCHNPIRIKLITRLRLALSHLRDHKFKQNFLDFLNPVCCYGKALKLQFITSFIAQFFQMKDHFFSTTFEALVKMS